MSRLWFFSLLAFSAAVAVALFGFTGFYGSGTVSSAAPARAAEGVKALSADGDARGVPYRKQTGSSKQAGEPSMLSVPNLAAKFAQVELLKATGQPADAYAAYKLVRGCSAARSAEKGSDQDFEGEATAIGQTTELVCGDISPGQISSRAHLLDIAAAAGIHGAARSFALEGPEGYGLGSEIVATDPVVLKWSRDLAEHLEAGAKTGDPWSLAAMSKQYESVGATGRALAYLVAVGELEKANTGQSSSGTERSISRMTGAMNPAVAASAIEYGHQIAVSAKKEGKQ